MVAVNVCKIRSGVSSTGAGWKPAVVRGDEKIGAKSSEEIIFLISFLII